MLSERKKLLALLSKRRELEQVLEYHSNNGNSSSNSSSSNNDTSATIQAQLNEMIPSLIHFFKCTDPVDLSQKYPTTAAMQAAAEKQRYFAPRKSGLNSKAAQVYEQIRDNGTDAEYLEFVRMTKATFMSIVASVLKQNPIFKQTRGLEPIEKQLAITLWRLGHHGKDAGIGDASRIFGLSEGSIMKCTQRCMEALNGIAVDVVRWPSQGEKRAIKNRIKELGKQPSTALASSTMSDDQLPEDESIDDAIGILVNMKVVLNMRPLIANRDEFMFPVAPRFLDAAAEWFASAGKTNCGQDLTVLELDQLTSTSSTPTSAAGPKRRKRRKASRTADSQETRQDSTSKVNGAEVDHGSESDALKRKPCNNLVSPSGSDIQQDSTSDPVTPISTTSTPSTSSAITTIAETALMSCRTGAMIDEDAAGVTTMAIDPAEDETPSDQALTDTPTGVMKMKSGGYVRRDYGYNVLIVCDSTTRVRLVETLAPASWSDQKSLESSLIHTSSTSYFDEGEYLVADGTFTLDDTILPATPVSELSGSILRSASAIPEATTIAQAVGGSDEIRIKMEDVDMYELDEEMMAKKRLYESLAKIHKRAQDCERMLKARFPSLLGVRVQVKGDQAGHDNVRSWIMACATIHNLVLADDSSFNPDWESQLDRWEELYEAHQGLVARYLWRVNNKPRRSHSKKSNANDPTRGSEDPSLGDMNDAEPETEGEGEGEGESELEGYSEAEAAPDTRMNTEEHTSVHARSSPPTNSAEDSNAPALVDHPSLSPLAPRDGPAESGPFQLSFMQGEANIVKELSRLSDSMEESIEDTSTLQQEHQQQAQEQIEFQHQHTSNHDLPSASSSGECQDRRSHSLNMLLN
ncbi:hypothetical protein EC991_002141 [Linnemannia zychae]|nr:hypothetical protein EC991_002141 [Linnemannia zychae]